MLKGKIALITGASRGIGAAIAKTLAKEGATVVINYNGSREKAEGVLAEVENRESMVYGCDVSKDEDCKTMIDKIIEKYGRLDILVNNAGITRDNLLMRMSEEDYDAVLNTNLKGSFHTMKYAAKYMMKQRSGKIVNISSVVGVIGNAGQANYCAAKAGLIGMTKSVARELAARNIQVNAVAPGFINTEMTQKLSESIQEGLKAQIPAKKIGAVEDIANAVTFLASPKADYITGQVLCVDGGMAM